MSWGVLGCALFRESAEFTSLGWQGFLRVRSTTDDCRRYPALAGIFLGRTDQTPERVGSGMSLGELIRLACDWQWAEH